MMDPEDIKKVIEEKLAGATAQVADLTGTFDHFEAQVTWAGFQGKSLIQQHQMVNKALEEALENGAIHALKIKTAVPK